MSLSFAQITDGCDLPDMNLYLSDDGSGDVLYNSSVDIGGVQFEVDGATINSASGGAAEAAGYFLSPGGNMLLAFSITGASVPAGCGILVNLNLSGTATGIPTASIVITDPSGNEYLPFVYYEPPADVSGCITSTACNYNAAATTDDGSCISATGCDTCSGATDGTGTVVDGDTNDNSICDVDECTSGVFDCNGVCDGSAQTDECGLCEGNGSSCVGQFPFNFSNGNSLVAFFINILTVPISWMSHTHC